MSTTETIMVATEVEVNPIFDAIVADLKLDPFADMQLVDVDGDVIDAMDRSLPPAWIWGFVEDDIQAQIDVLTGRVALQAIKESAVPMSLTGAYRMIAAGERWELPEKAAPMMPAEIPAVDPWASSALAAIVDNTRPQSLTDTMTQPIPVSKTRARFMGERIRDAKKSLDEQTLLGLMDEAVDVPPAGE